MTRFVMLVLVLPALCLAQDASAPGEVQPEPATLHCLAVRWPIVGDANTNAVVEVRYRRKGDATWKEAFPLIRCVPDPHPENQTPAVRVPGGRLFAGSIVNLAPDTEYEVKLNLKDPDGGDAERTLTMRTRAEPRQPEGMRTLHVTTGEGGGNGSEADPFKGLYEAVAAARPGDLLLIRPGTYAIKETVVIKRSGEAGKPIILRGVGEVVLDGGGTHETKGVILQGGGLRHIWLENLTLRGRQYAIAANSGSNWVVRRCTFRDMTQGFTSHNGDYERSRGHFITDNTFIGPTTWPRTKGIEAPCSTYLSGAGHVIAYNRMSNLGDGAHGTGNGNLSASDYHNNDINVCTDDGLEADYGVTNIRIFNNRIVNVAHGITAQPAMGGPLYFFRNVIYNATYSPFKLHNHTTGVVLFHNTSLRHGPCFLIQPASETVTNVLSRNNLFLGTGGNALHTSGRMRQCDFDADGYGGFTAYFLKWNEKAYRTGDDAKAAGVLYAKHGMVLVDPKTCFAGGLLPPADEKVEYKGADLDFRLKAGSGALDRGVILPNFSDGYVGKAPDLGALELGAEPPHYGPRPQK